MLAKMHGFTVTQQVEETNQVKLKGIKKLVAKVFKIPVKEIYNCNCKVIVYMDAKDQKLLSLKVNSILSTIDGSLWKIKEQSDLSIVIENIYTDRRVSIISFDKMSVVSNLSK